MGKQGKLSSKFGLGAVMAKEIDCF